jgi:malonyl-CoA/methylmalonyl-CoA synthetase
LGTAIEANVTTPAIPLLARAHAHAARRALIAPDGTWSYADLLEQSARVAETLLAGSADLAEARVAFLVPPSCAHVAVQWGIWRAGGVAVPLCVSHPAPELEYVIDDAQASIVVADAGLSSRVRPLAVQRQLRFQSTEDVLPTPSPPRRRRSGVLQRSRVVAVEADRRAMILYTSGTTSRPKGVVTTHAMLTAQIESVVRAWEWSARDHVLHVLPLHHLHGILNLLCCPLWAGATCELQAGFDAEAVWRRIAAADGLTVYMAVPTIYARLLAAFRAAPAARQAAMRAGCRRLRLMVSGSAALSPSLFDAWQDVSGHPLLERYGMTEIGMGLGNPLYGERLPGSVGRPFPGVSVRLVDEAQHAVPDGMPGEIQVRGPTVFREYWRRPEATREAFTADGWFRTGDVATRADGVYRILGRASIDIIKTGGYKVSALEIEEALRAHPGIADCAVVAVDDPEWGQRVAAAVVVVAGATLDLDALRQWAKQRLAPYKVPTLLRVVADLPRNPMGKVVKSQVARIFG